MRPTINDFAEVISSYWRPRPKPRPVVAPEGIKPPQRPEVRSGDVFTHQVLHMPVYQKAHAQILTRKLEQHLQSRKGG